MVISNIAWNDSRYSFQSSVIDHEIAQKGVYKPRVLKIYIIQVSRFMNDKICAKIGIIFIYQDVVKNRNI